MSTNWTIRRRHLLTGAGAALALPLLESLMPRKKAWAAGTTDPRRFVAMYMPNGTYNVINDAVWYPPAGPLQASNLPLVLQPFTNNIMDFSVIMHQGCNARDQFPFGGGHFSADTTWLTQAIIASNSPQCTMPGSSIDQLYANTTSSQKNVLALSAGCQSNYPPDSAQFPYQEYISFKDGQPLAPIKNVVELFTSTFASLGTTAPPVPTVNAVRNHSVLDVSLAELKDMQSKLGKTDNQKLDQYMTSVRDLETKLYSSQGVAGGCNPKNPPDPSLNTDDNDGANSDIYNQRVEAFCDMIVLAFQCDIFRSVSFQYDDEVSDRLNNQCPMNLVYGGADLSGALHVGISHYGQNDNGRAKCISRDRNYMYLFTYLLTALKNALDPSMTPILDNTVVLAGFNVTDGVHENQWEGQPLVMGGGKNLGFHPGNCFEMRTKQGPPQRFDQNNNYGPGGLPAAYDMTDIYYTIGMALGMPSSAFSGTPFDGAGQLSL